MLSQECLVQLGVLPPSFPTVGQFADTLEERTETVYKSSTLNMIKSGGKQLAKQPVGECDPESILPCQCPRRTFADPPEELPMDATADNREKLEAWILEYYAV